LRASLENLSPEQAALLLAVGLVLGVFPVMGCPTILCLLAAPGFRLNLAALQLLNNACSPLQLALLFPLARAGAWLCGGKTSAGIGIAALHAIAGWTCICVPLGVLLYLLLVALMRKRHSAWSNSLKSPA
jgi:uncharacterized protein (DUF2062 family)